MPQEATIKHAALHYQKISAAAMSGRDTECAAFRMVNRDLATCTQGMPRIRAIGRNHTLWSLLVKDLAQADNRLPDNLKTGLISLGMWAMNYSTRAILQDLSVEPLIDVNINVLDGLLGQSMDTAADLPPSPFDA